MKSFNEKKNKRIPIVNFGANSAAAIGFEAKDSASRRIITLASVLAAIYVLAKKIFKKKIPVNFHYFDGLSLTCRKIKENAQNWRALDIIYNYKYGSENAITDFWLDMYNAQAVRNRLRIMKYLLREKIKEVARKNGGKVRIISIASGSAQGIIELMGEMKKESIEVESILIDRDKTAHDYAKELALNHGVDKQISFYQENASFVEKIGAVFRPQIVEMVGFLEYRNDQQTIKLIDAIFGVLENSGYFFTSQISANKEMFFLRQVIDWPMKYRGPSSFDRIIKKTKFYNRICFFYWEPFKIHFVIECKKS